MLSPTLPRASVVIPLFQKAPYIRRALESVFRQTMENIEVIVIDDGSTDDAPHILASIADPRLTVHRQPHAGVSVARNRGIGLARAEWVGFLDADDEWLPSFLEAAMRTAETSAGVSAIFSNLRDHATGRLLLTKVDREGSLVRDYFATVLANDGQGMSSSSVLASKSHLVACRGFPEGVQLGEDIDLWARLAWSGEIAFCDEATAVCHSEVPDSASKNVRAAIAPYPVFLRSYEEWSATERIPARLRESSRQYAIWLLARHVMELAHQGSWEEARQLLSDARWCGSADPLLLKAELWTRLPTGVLRTGRRLRAFLRRGPGSR